MAKLREAGELYKTGDLAGCLSLVQGTWNSLPAPKEETPNAYLLVEYAVAVLLQTNELDSALSWAMRAPLFASRRHQLGEAEFLLGKVHFARGEREESKRFFAEAQSKSSGKIFQGENPEYLRLAKEK